MNQLPKQQNYIDGQWQAPQLDLQRALHNANTGEQIGAQFSSSAAQIDAAIQSAYNAFESGRWSQLSYDERAAYLEKIASNLGQHGQSIEMCDALQTGVLQSLTKQFASVCAMAFTNAANLLRALPAETEYEGAKQNAIVLERLPLGVAAIIAPWNAPSGIACHKIASALAAGCPVLFKPSEWAAGSAQAIAQAIVDADLPHGTFQLLHGDGKVGAALCSDDRVAAVSFTGGALGGEAVGGVCGANIKPAQLELGGNNALVVLASADLDAAADGIITGMTTLNGQWCRALGRLIVHSSVADGLLAKVASRLETLVIGESTSASSQMGPLVHQGHWQHVQQRIAEYVELGAELIRPSTVPAHLTGWFMAPTLITGLSGEACREEIFGPVATVHTFETAEQATQLANQTDYGLAAYVFGAEADAWPVARKLRAGVIKINGVSLFALRGDLPRAAWGKSGLGDEGTRETFEFFRGTRVIGIA
ncbi:aldehyde dehydrogenase family protein [Shewanella acanthi]|uniref:aldehyde dehydrogenase family protein n=1 Tax=Shewanella acanthi TaxID=2864212 RepID=UPI001C6618AD|nr:aldehyde dehydrogenase [Shewanella acanthi]QYJ78839.1 aldehyde dehydrogenase family protein [Shewanella acanthi]